MSFSRTEIEELRHSLHKNPELSFAEHQTAKRIEDFVSQFSPDKIIKGIGGTGVAFVFAGDKNRPRILLRADLDALPIHENMDIQHASTNKNVSHKCGHDGHMAMVASLAPVLKNLDNRGDVVLFFQPGEEVGEGALRSLDTQSFSDLKPDYVFGLHNLPEYPAGEIVIRDDTFACCSLGLKVDVVGKSSHAAQPEEALSPLPQVALVSQQIEDLNHLVNDDDFFLSTLTHLKLGEESFGITPGKLTLFYTLRAARDEVLDDKKQKAIKIIESHFEKPFQLNVQSLDVFPATINHQKAVYFLRKAIANKGYNANELPAPIRWSEDFGYFTRRWPGAYFGLGIGSANALHTPLYDFNDDVLEVGHNIYLGLIEAINEEYSAKN